MGIAKFNLRSTQVRKRAKTGLNQPLRDIHPFPLHSPHFLFALFQVSGQKLWGKYCCDICPTPPPPTYAYFCISIFSYPECFRRPCMASTQLSCLPRTTEDACTVITAFWVCVWEEESPADLPQTAVLPLTVIFLVFFSGLLLSHAVCVIITWHLLQLQATCRDWRSSDGAGKAFSNWHRLGSVYCSMIITLVLFLWYHARASVAKQPVTASWASLVPFGPDCQNSARLQAASLKSDERWHHKGKPLWRFSATVRAASRSSPLLVSCP